MATSSAVFTQSYYNQSKYNLSITTSQIYGIRQQKPTINLTHVTDWEREKGWYQRKRSVVKIKLRVMLAKQTLPQLLQEDTAWNRFLAIYRGNELSPQLSAVAPS